ncbi:hypothetical protein B0H13DRAFT_2368684 [Mycena leptocephala]|nr:hypothetical protein B0H13DRAFT_2368684 [Mycena leptocephala]
MSNVPLHWLQKTPPRPPRDAGPAQRDDSDEETAQNREFNPPASSSLALELNLRKRPAPEDLGQYANSLSRKLRLKLQAHEELRLFSQLTGPQQSVWIAAHLLEGSDQLSSLVPAEARYRIPTGLEGRIDMGAFLTLVDHKAPSYVHKSATSGPVVRLLNYLEKHPSWGLTSEVKGDKAKYEVIKGRARYQLTKFRNLIKDAIKDSVGHACDPADVVPGGPTRKDAQDILVLCQRVLALGAKVAPDVKLSAELAGRMAYVCFIYQKNLDKSQKKGDKSKSGSRQEPAETIDSEVDGDDIKDKEDKVPKFWEAVNKALAEVRDVTKGAEDAMSRLFSRSLQEDMAIYGCAKLDDLAANALHTL